MPILCREGPHERIPRLRQAALTANSYWTLNKLLAGAGTRTVGGRIRRQAHPSGWTVRYEGMVRMMMAGTPSHDIHSAQQIREPLDRLTQLTGRCSRRQRRVAFTHLTGEWVTPSGAAADCCVYYLHGGGYVCGSCATHRAVVGRIAGAAGVPAFSLDYRLAPEHPFPCGGCGRVDGVLVAGRTGLFAAPDRVGRAIRPAAGWRWPCWSRCATRGCRCRRGRRSCRRGWIWRSLRRR